MSEIAQRPDQSTLVPALASLVVPGLGQFLIGQRMRGIRLFLGSASVFFGLGVCNVLVAYDAWSMARRLQEGPIGSRHSSWTLIAFGLAWDLFCLVVGKVLEILGTFPIIKEVLVIRDAIRNGR